MNERIVTINSAGVLNYFHFDKPGIVKGHIDLTSSQIQTVRFNYAGHASQAKKKSEQQRPAANIDDEFRIQMSNKDIFIFKASKADQSKSNASIERWEREIRKFAKNVRINF